MKRTLKNLSNYMKLEVIPGPLEYRIEFKIVLESKRNSLILTELNLCQISISLGGKVLMHG